MNSENNIENIRTQIIDGIIAPYLGSLIGIDIVDIVNLINEYYDAMKSQFRQVGNHLTEIL